jgi:hypothetical protein
MPICLIDDTSVIIFSTPIISFATFTRPWPLLRVARWVPHVEQELITFQDHLHSPSDFWWVTCCSFLVTNKQTRKQTHHHTVRTVRKSNRKIVEKGKFNTLSTHIIDDHSLSPAFTVGFLMGYVLFIFSFLCLFDLIIACLGLFFNF